MKKIELLSGLLLAAAGLYAAETNLADFTGPHGWAGPHHMKDLHASAQGYTFTVTDEDPWLVSPPVTLPAVPAEAREVAFTVTCAPTTDASPWQLFFGCNGRGFSEADSCRLQPVGSAPYTTFRAQLPVPPNFAGPARLRLDPPGGTNTYTVARLALDYVKPLWTYQPAAPAPLAFAKRPILLKGPDWELRHDPERLGAFRYTSRGKTVENNPCEPFVYLDASGAVRTLDWSQVKLQRAKPKPGAAQTSLATRGQCTDADGRRWTIDRVFMPGDGHKLRVTTRIAVDGDTPAQILHVPALTLFVDRASQGRKHQALLPGVEYLADEPSSNEKEIRTAEHNRQIPAEPCLSAPFAVFTDEQNWFAANWAQFEQNGKTAQTGVARPFAVVFDTPDRLMKSGGHLLAFWAPAVGSARRPSALDIYQPTAFRRAVQIVEFSSGAGNDVATVLATLLPPTGRAKLPPTDTVDRTAALEQLAHGWLDSEIRQGLDFRHAINGNSFPAGKAADAPCLMRALAAELKDGDLAARLRRTADEILAAIPPQDVPHRSVSHVKRPAPVLLAGDVARHLDEQAATLNRLNAALANGTRTWHAPASGRRNLGETLGDTHCNGYTAMEADLQLSAATWSGDEAAIDKALAVVDKITQIYHGTVPRGAQPWEMPLHTPDIMASAHLARVYTLAYQLRPDPNYLAEARHWAYTGLAFVYLVPPTYPTAAAQDPVGTYATCAVMGATGWVAPNWIGRPVQWCGLVYAAALYDLGRLDPTHGELWRQVAVGITTSGMRQTYTAADDPRYAGLLPDSWNLEKQDRYWCPINPGTVEENFLEAIDRPFYSLRVLAGSDTQRKPALLHLAGAAEALPPAKGHRRARIACWSETPSKAVVTRLEKPAAVTLDGQPVPFDYLPRHRAVVLTLPARARGELDLAAQQD